MNGEEASLKDFRELVGFVPQEDIMLRELTVEENIRHSALMRLPTGLSHEEKMDRVYQVMESLDLLHIRNSIIGDEIVRGISGGQRKRVNVAMELVADPSLLALDEPTSGLDSTTSSKLCETLCQLALAGGVNVAAVIHQPKIEILEKFTNVLLLGVGGKTVYMGPTKNMTDYFTGIGFPLPSQMNPADYYMDVIAGIIPCENNPNFKKEELFDLWNNSPENPGSNLEVDDGNNENDTVPQKMKGKAEKAFGNLKKTFGNLKKGRQKKYRTTPGIVGQTYLLMKRAILQRCRVPRNTLIPLILSASAAVLIGYYTQTILVYYYGIPIVSTDRFNAASQFMSNHPVPPNNAIPQVWLLTALTIMLVCIVSINTFGLEKAVFLREAFSGTNPTSVSFLHLMVFISFFMFAYLLLLLLLLLYNPSQNFVSVSLSLPLSFIGIAIVLVCENVGSRFVVTTLFCPVCCRCRYIQTTSNSDIIILACGVDVNDWIFGSWTYRVTITSSDQSWYRPFDFLFGINYGI